LAAIRQVAVCLLKPGTGILPPLSPYPDADSHAMMTKRLNVLHTESSPSLGGQELRILLEMEHLVSRGINSVLAARPNTPILHEARRRGLTAYEVPMRFNLDPASMWRLRQIIRRHQIHVVNAHNSKDSWCIAPIARLMGLGIVRARHIANPVRQSRSTRLIYGPLCDAVQTTSESIREHLISRGVAPDKIQSIPTGIDPERFSTAQPGSLRSDLGIPADVPLVGQIAVMRGDKGPDSFVRAAQIALNNGSPAWFVLVGEGPARAKVERILAEGGHADRIKLAGYRRDIPSVLADLELFVLAAHANEGVPQAILQAHASQCPVITTDRGGINEVAISGQTARVVPPRDPVALAQAIDDMLKDQQTATLMASAGHTLLHERYTLSHMLDQMEMLYRNLATKLL